MNISEHVVHFFSRQEVLFVSTIGADGHIYSAIKGLVGIEPAGKIFIVDLFKGRTYKNLQQDSRITITAIDEKHFLGYTIQGHASIVPREDIVFGIMSEWEERIIQRISNRIVNNVRSGKRSGKSHEADLPGKPEYLIEICVENIIDISPPK